MYVRFCRPTGKFGYRPRKTRLPDTNERNLRPLVCGGGGRRDDRKNNNVRRSVEKNGNDHRTRARRGITRAGDDSAAYSRRPEPARAAGTGTCPASAGDRAPLNGDSVQFSHSYRSFVCRSPSARPFGRSSFSYVRDIVCIAVFGLVRFRPLPPVERARVVEPLPRVPENN